MKYYIQIEANITEMSWLPHYMETVPSLMQEFGGRYLARTANVNLLEGEGAPSQFVVLAEFESKQAFDLFYNSERYLPFKQARQAGADCRILQFPGEAST